MRIAKMPCPNSADQQNDRREHGLHCSHRSISLAGGSRQRRFGSTILSSLGRCLSIPGPQAEDGLEKRPLVFYILKFIDTLPEFAARSRSGLECRPVSWRDLSGDGELLRQVRTKEPNYSSKGDLFHGHLSGCQC